MGGYFKLWLAVILLLQTLVGTIGGAGTAYYFYHNKKICPGVEIAGIPVGGLDVASARKKLDEKLPPLSALKLQGEEKIFPLTLEEGVYEYLIDDALAKALSPLDPNSGGWNKILNTVRWRPSRQRLEVPVAISFSFLRRELEALRGEIDREPENALLIIEKGIPFYREEKPGVRLDVLKSIAIIEEHLKRGVWEGIPLEVRIIPPSL